MNCYVCLTDVGVAKEMAGLCRFCGVAVCAGHFTEVAGPTQGGMHYTCNHSALTPARIVRVEAAQSGAASQYVAVCKCCGIALTPADVVELAKQGQGGMRYGCNHTPRAPRPV